MSLIQIIISSDLVCAYLVYMTSILIFIPLFEWIHRKLNHLILHWAWDHVGMPLLRAVLMVIFIFIAYPSIFGLSYAPPLSSLLAVDDMRIHYLINAIFVLTLLFPLIPFFGRWDEFILPAQGMAASLLLFSWLAEARGISDVSYWPGFYTLACILVISIGTHWLAVSVSNHLGHLLNKIFYIHDSAGIISRGIILFMQSPSILIFSLALGKQLG